MPQNSKYLNNDLLREFRMGNEAAFNEVFTELYPALCYYSSNFTSNQESSEEIASEAFIKVWQRRGMFFKFDILKSYLYKIVRNDSLNWIRSQSRRIALNKKFGDLAPSFETTIWENMVSTEVLRELHAAINYLPAKKREIFKMLFDDGMTVKEVAHELDLSISTVKDHKRDGIIFLRRNLLFFILVWFTIYT